MHKEYEVLRGLAAEIADIASLPVQQEKKQLWTSNNDLVPARPLVYIDQLPWHEINASDEMRLECGDAYLRTIEQRLREILYRWRHFPCDMVVEERIDIPHSYHGLEYGMRIKEKGVWTNRENDIYSHEYAEQLNSQEDIDNLPYDNIVVDHSADKRHYELCSEIFRGILPVRFEGVQIHTGVWDRIAQLRKPDNLLIDLIDRPEHTRAIVIKLRDITMDTVRQCEALGLLDNQIQYVHCTGAYTNDLPKTQGGDVKAKNVWAFGMSQIFSTVSKDMHKEFDIDLLMPLYDMFGLMYYGCCEPLHDKIDIIRKIRNVRKISISPWADIEKGAESISGDYVFSLKPRPSLIGNGVFEEDEIRDQLQRAKDACKKHNTPCEFILKDVSTVRNRLDFLDRWNDLAMTIAMS
ncbi:MAG: hypothetical protein PHP02_08790 [Eubacteriales bacterium]|nr:hypothetical protein [Eubacteriales bacterium]